VVAPRKVRAEGTFDAVINPKPIVVAPMAVAATEALAA
jgi:hypothetical protein